MYRLRIEPASVQKVDSMAAEFEDLDEVIENVDTIKEELYDYVTIKIVGSYSGDFANGDAEFGIVPRTGDIEEVFAITDGTTAATATITVKNASYSDFPTTFATLGSFEISGAHKATADLETEWTTAVTGGSILKASVSPVGETLSGSVLYVVVKIKRVI